MTKLDYISSLYFPVCNIPIHLHNELTLRGCLGGDDKGSCRKIIHKCFDIKLNTLFVCLSLCVSRFVCLFLSLSLSECLFLPTSVVSVSSYYFSLAVYLFSLSLSLYMSTIFSFYLNISVSIRMLTVAF